MRRAMKLLWREWRENRWFLYAGLLLLMAWPLVSALRPIRGSSSDPYWATNSLVGIRETVSITCAMVLSLGGLLAIVVGVAAGCRDMRGRVSDFWLSRPVRLWSWLSARYLAGLATVLVATTVPLLTAMTLYLVHPVAADPSKYRYIGDVFTHILLHGALLALIYSLAMLLGLLVRRPSHAAILALAAALLVYFLPILVPPLGAMNFWNFVENPGNVPAAAIPVKIPWMSQWTPAQLQAAIGRFRGFTVAGWFLGLTPEGLKFMALVAMLTVVVAAAAFVAARRQWRIRMDQKLMVWSLGGVTLLLVAALAFQLSSNLDPELRTRVQPPGADSWRMVFAIHASANRGVLVLYHTDRQPPQNGTLYTAATFELSDGQLKLGPEIVLGEDPLRYYSARYGVTSVVWSPKHPNRLYQLLRRYERVDHGSVGGQSFYSAGKCLEMSLRTLALDSNPPGRVVHTLDLSPPGEDAYSFEPMLLMGDRVYVRSNLPGSGRSSTVRCHIVDLADGDEPQIIATTDSSPVRWRAPYDVSVQRAVTLPELPDLSPRERFAVVFGLRDYTDHPAAWQGDLLVSADRQTKAILTRRLVFEGNTVRVEPLGERRPTPLESRITHFSNGGVLRGNYFYATVHSLSSGVSVFDVSDPERPRRVAFYASRNVGGLLPMAVLDDGRLLLGGRELHVIEPVPAR